ncbi:MAG: hypothetical protein R3E82_09175 [Pseudomonadales bacterium]
MKLKCWNCGHDLDDVPRPISRHEHCRKCFEALHACRQCRHFRHDLNSRCFEDRADPPMNKENANFCDYFRPDGGAFSSRRPRRSEAAHSRLNSLFASGDDPQEDSGQTAEAPTDPVDAPAEKEAPVSPKTAEEQARDRLDSLFPKR